MNRHHVLQPEGMSPPVGFSHGMVAAEGRLLFIAGQTGHNPDLTPEDGVAEQFRRACDSVAKVIEEAGGEPSDLVSMTIYTTDMAGYRAALDEIGVAYRAVFGKHYPPMALIGVSELFDPAALVELVCVAVVPES